MKKSLSKYRVSFREIYIFSILSTVKLLCSFTLRKNKIANKMYICFILYKSKQRGIVFLLLFETGFHFVILELYVEQAGFKLIETGKYLRLSDQPV